MSNLLTLLSSGTGTPPQSDSQLPVVFALHQNYPNPFNAVTTVKYDLPEISDVKIEIFNVLGQRVMTLVNGIEQPGYKVVKWNGNYNDGSNVASGIYICRIQVDGKETGKAFGKCRKMMLLK